MARYLCDDGGAEVEYEADSPQEAAQQYVDDGDWNKVEETSWVRVWVQEMRECEHRHMADPTGSDAGRCLECGERCTGTDNDEYDICQDDNCPIHGDGKVGKRESYMGKIEPELPDCDGERAHPECEPDEASHDWHSPHSVLGGIKDNPGVWGHGGGVIIKEVCANCGLYRITDTWAQDHETGVEGLHTVRYEDADKASLNWVAKQHPSGNDFGRKSKQRRR